MDFCHAVAVAVLADSPVNDRPKFFTSTKKPISCKNNQNVGRTRVCDKPRTPFQRLLDPGVLSPAEERELFEDRDGLKPGELAC